MPNDRYMRSDFRDLTVTVNYAARVGMLTLHCLGIISVDEALTHLREDGWTPSQVFGEGLFFALNHRTYVHVNLGALEPDPSVAWEQVDVLIAAGRTHEEIYAAGVAALSAARVEPGRPDGDR